MTSLEALLDNLIGLAAVDGLRVERLDARAPVRCRCNIL